MQISKRKLILHVGLPKTASCSIQKLLHDKRDIAAQYGLEYPETGSGDVTPRHQFLVSDLLRNSFVKTNEILESCRLPRLMLSAEGLSNRLYDFSDKALAEFAKLVRNWEVHVLLVLREPRSFERSYYAQVVLNPAVKGGCGYATSLKFRDFVTQEWVRRLTDFKTLTHDIGKAFRAEEVCTGWLESDWLDKLSQVTELNFLRDCKPPRINETPPRWAIELMRQVNHYNLPESRRQVWRAVLHEITGSSHTLFLKARDEIDLASTVLEPKILAELKPCDDPDFPLSEAHIAEIRNFV
jgi:hypothetical protein